MEHHNVADYALDEPLPGWVPPCVGQTAKKLWRDIVTEDGEIAEKTKILRRLIFDPRMEQVWNLLRKKKRGTDYQPSEAFLYPAISSPTSKREVAAELRQKVDKARRRRARCSKR